MNGTGDARQAKDACNFGAIIRIDDFYQDHINQNYRTNVKMPVVFHSQLISVACDSSKEAGLDSQIIKTKQLEEVASGQAGTAAVHHDAYKKTLTGVLFILDWRWHLISAYITVDIQKRRGGDHHD